MSHIVLACRVSGKSSEPGRVLVFHVVGILVSGLVDNNEHRRDLTM